MKINKTTKFKRRMQIFSLLSVFALVAPAMAMDLEPLSDEDLSNVRGREGVAISFDYYYNSDPTTGRALTSGDYACGDGANYENCLFTWQIAGREHGDEGWGPSNAFKGEWLVYKEGYLTLNVKRLALESSFLGQAKSAASNYESFHNEEKFKGKIFDGTSVDHSIQCLLEVDCSVASLKETPALRTYYPDTHGSYNAATGTSTGYDDVRVGLAFERLAIEYDNGTTPGYEQDLQGSFAGLRITDTNDATAGIAFGGSFYMYGF